MTGFYLENEQALNEETMHLLPQFQMIQREAGNDALVYNLHDHMTEVLEKAGLWEKASCKGACSFCCHDTIYMPPLEAAYVQKNITEHGIVGNVHRKELQSSGKDLTFMEKACPYLEDENEEGRRLCSIYEFRPMVCRTHNSTEPIEFCNKELYPDRMINEGRIVHTEALITTLMMMQYDVDANGNPIMTPIHTLK